ncbi:AmmeMemoRadiSam system protein B [endosymbiont of Riftia pachyptila]|nr:AmmeMemoRadiSam system protein B [endosymbiont of Riftia pachyptila]
MGGVRTAAVAGLFYPDAPAELRAMVDDYLGQAGEGRPPKAIVAPHAGFVYSGPVAASVYHRLTPVADRISRVVLLGPSHRVAFRGLALSSAQSFQTPLGEIPLEQVSDELLRLPQLSVNDMAHAQEHSLEVQLPFLQRVLGEFRLLPIVVGDASGAEVAEVLEQVWDGEETLIVISSDLSHYHDYLTAQQMDRTTSDAILALQPERLHYEDACGRIPLQGLLEVAQRKGLDGELVDLRNSGDTAGLKDRVVGYGAYAFAVHSQQ